MPDVGYYTLLVILSFQGIDKQVNDALGDKLKTAATKARLKAAGHRGCCGTHVNRRWATHWVARRRLRLYVSRYPRRSCRRRRQRVLRMAAVGAAGSLPMG
jgi:hypothetical protein